MYNWKIFEVHFQYVIKRNYDDFMTLIYDLIGNMMCGWGAI